MALKLTRKLSSGVLVLKDRRPLFEPKRDKNGNLMEDPKNPGQPLMTTTPRKDESGQQMFESCAKYVRASDLGKWKRTMVERVSGKTGEAIKDDSGKSLMKDSGKGEYETAIQFEDEAYALECHSAILKKA